MQVKGDPGPYYLTTHIIEDALLVQAAITKSRITYFLCVGVVNEILKNT